MTIQEILKKAHRQWDKTSDYPDPLQDEWLVYVDHANDAIDEWESCVHEGYVWPALRTSALITFGGSGRDTLPEDFLSFIPQCMSGPTTLVIGGQEYTRIDACESGSYVQGTEYGTVFWAEGNIIRTLPAATGTYTIPYVRKATRYLTGMETVQPEMENHAFITMYVLAKTFADNNDHTGFTLNMTAANEKLDKMKYAFLG